VSDPLAVFDRGGIAERVRTIVGNDALDIATLAKRLRVEESVLLLAIDPADARPTVDVIVAVIREYGVDPTWILTGEYDASTHRQATDGDRAMLLDVLRSATRRRETPGWSPHVPDAFPSEPPESRT
jgi:hypothetical protein